MTQFEYKVVPAPVRGEKARGVKTTADRFALALTQLMNQMAREGWEYLRADTLPCEERTGFTGRATSYQNLLTFRRPAAESVAVELPRQLTAATEMAPAPAAPAPVPPAPAAEPPSPTKTFGREVVASLRGLTGDARPAEKPAEAALTATPPMGEAPPLSTASEPGKTPKLGPAGS